jgi:hypothetical protein
MSVEGVLALERKIRENKAAQLRGEPPVHVVTMEEMRDAVNAIRRTRGTMDLAAVAKAGKSRSGASSIEIVDLEGL